jgi:GDP-L-fucose synthase
VDPVNLGTGREVKIKDLVGIIARLCNYTGEIVWDAAKPEGQPRRCVDISKAKERFGFEASVELAEGLERTIEWYKAVYAGSK